MKKMTINDFKRKVQYVLKRYPKADEKHLYKMLGKLIGITIDECYEEVNQDYKVFDAEICLNVKTVTELEK